MSSNMDVNIKITEEADYILEKEKIELNKPPCKKKVSKKDLASKAIIKAYES